MAKLRTNKDSLTGPERAAIVFLCLSDDLGASMMEELEQEEVTAVTRALAGLGNVSADVVEEVITDFTGAMVKGTDVVGNHATAEKLLLRFMPEDRVNAIMDEVRGPLQGRNMWDRISELDEGVIARYLRGEYPQTIAAILSKMRPDVSAKVLPLLPKAQMMDVVERMIQMEAVPVDVYDDIEETLKQEFLVEAMDQSSSDPHERMANVFNRIDQETLNGLFEELEKTMPDALQRIKQKMFTFEDLTRLDRQSIARVIRRAEGRVLPTALKGVQDEVREIFFAALPERSRNILLEEMQTMGPVRMREVQEAQTRLVEIAKQLEEDGEIILPQGDEEEQILY